MNETGVRAARSIGRPLAIGMAAALAVGGVAAVDVVAGTPAQAAPQTYEHPSGATVTYDNTVVAGQPIHLSGTGWLVGPDAEDSEAFQEGNEGSITGVKFFPDGGGDHSEGDAGFERQCKITNPYNGDIDYVNVGVWDIIQAAGSGSWWEGATPGDFDVDLAWPAAYDGEGDYACGAGGYDAHPELGIAKQPMANLQPGDTFSLQLLSGTMYGVQQCPGGAGCGRPDVSRTIKLEFTVVADDGSTDPEPAATTASVKFSAPKRAYNASNTAKVTVAAKGSDVVPTGKASIKIDGKSYSAALKNGAASIKLTKPVAAGTQKVKVAYRSDNAAAFADYTKEAVTSVTVTKATPKVSLKLAASKIKASTYPKVTVKTSVSGSLGAKASKSKLYIYDGGKRIKSTKLNSSGAITTRVPKLKAGTHKIKVKVVGTANLATVNSSAKTIKAVK